MNLVDKVELPGYMDITAHLLHFALVVLYNSLQITGLVSQFTVQEDTQLRN